MCYSSVTSKIFAFLRNEGLEDDMDFSEWIFKTFMSATISWLTGQILSFMKNKLPAIRHFFEGRSRRK